MDGIDFNARLTGPAVAHGGMVVSARFDGDQLVIAAAGVRVDAAQLVVSVGGIDQPELFLNWLDGNRVQSSLQALTAADVAALLEGAPAALQPQLTLLWQRRLSNRRQVWGWLLGGTGLVAALTLAAWLAYPALTGWLAQQVPIALEEKLGQAALSQLRDKGGLVDSGPLQQQVQAIGEQLTAGSAYHYRWLVKQDASINAFAMPGGIIVVHTGLLARTDNPGELAAVLAHEVQHIEQRHTLKKMMGSLGLAAVVFVVVGDVSSVAATIAHQVGSNYFSRDLEDEADRRGLQALLRAHIKPDGMVSFFQKLALSKQASGAAVTVPAWLSSHPATSQRIANIQAMIRQQPCPACRTLTVAGDWKRLMATASPAPRSGAP